MKGTLVEHVVHEDRLLAVILSAGFNRPGIHFFTEPELSQQLAYMQHRAGTDIEPHVHNRLLHEVQYTQEVLFIRSGRLRVDFYTDNGTYLESRELGPGDTILLAAGGHGFHVLEQLEMIEVKQGPYLGDATKTRFPAVAPEDVRMPPRP
jgi:mannose-6-phosphate isomerase-like protein (cupin superfamily)